MHKRAISEKDIVFEGETLGQVMQLSLNWLKAWPYDNKEEEAAADKLKKLARETHQAWALCQFSKTKNQLISRIEKASQLHYNLLQARLEYINSRSC